MTNITVAQLTFLWSELPASLIIASSKLTVCYVTSQNPAYSQQQARTFVDRRPYQSN